MNNKEKAEIILESLDEYIQVDWNFEEFYIKGIIKGLKKIDKKKSSKLGKAHCSIDNSIANFILTYSK